MDPIRNFFNYFGFFESTPEKPLETENVQTPSVQESSSLNESNPIIPKISPISDTKYDLNKPYSLPPVKGGIWGWEKSNFVNPCYKLVSIDFIENNYSQYTDLNTLFIEKFKNENCQGLIIKDKNGYLFVNDTKNIKYSSFAEAQDEIYKFSAVETQNEICKFSSLGESLPGNYLIEDNTGLNYVIFDESREMTVKMNEEKLNERLFQTINLDDVEGYKDIKNTNQSIKEVLKNNSNFRAQVLKKMENVFPSLEFPHLKIAYVSGSKMMIVVENDKADFFPVGETLYTHLNKKVKIETKQNVLIDDVTQKIIDHSTYNSFLSLIERVSKIATPVVVFLSMLQVAAAKISIPTTSDGPFNLLELRNQGTLPTNLLKGFQIIPLTQSQYVGAFIKSETLSNFTRSTTSLFNTQPDGSIKLGTERTITTIPSDQFQPIPKGIELDPNTFAEIFSNSTKEIWVNVIDSSTNNVKNTCRVVSGTNIFKKVNKFDPNNVIITVLGNAFFVNLGNCKSTSLTAGALTEPSEIYVFDDTSQFILFYYRFLSDKIDMQSFNKNGTTLSYPDSIAPKFINQLDPNAGLYRVMKQNPLIKNATLLEFPSQPTSQVCSQTMEPYVTPYSNYYFKLTDNPKCQNLTRINNIIKIIVEKFSQNQAMPYITKIDFTPDKQQKQTQVTPISPSFQIPKEDKQFPVGPFPYDDSNWSDPYAERTFITPDPLDPSRFYLYTPTSTGLKYYSINMNSIIAKNMTSFTGEVNWRNNTVKPFDYTPPLRVRYNFTLVNQKESDDSDFTFNVDDSGNLNIYATKECARKIFAQACSEETGSCAQITFTVKIIDSTNYEKDLTWLYIVLASLGGAIGYGCYTTPLVCIFFGGTIFITRKLTIQRYDKKLKHLQTPFLKEQYYDEFQKMLPAERKSKILKLINKGKEALNKKEIKIAKKCFYDAINLDPTSIEALTALLNFFETERLFPNGFGEGMAGESYLKDFEIKSDQSIEYVKNKGKHVRLGQGANGTVFKGKLVTVDQKNFLNPYVTENVALKTFYLNDENRKDIVKKANIEAEIMLKFSGLDYLVPCLGFHSKNTDEYVLIMKYMSGGTLTDMVSYNSIPDELKHNIILRILLGLTTLHANGVVHRDLKPDNILFNKNFKPAISDFGTARMHIDKLKDTIQVAGTRLYMAPEVLKQLERSSDSNFVYTKASDIYSTALIILYILKGEDPFNVTTIEELVDLVINQQKHPNIPNNWHPDLINMLKLCFSAAPEKRPTAIELYRTLLSIPPDGLVGNTINKVTESNTLNYNNAIFELNDIEEENQNNEHIIEINNTAKSNTFNYKDAIFELNDIDEENQNDDGSENKKLLN